MSVRIERKARRSASVYKRFGIKMFEGLLTLEKIFNATCEDVFSLVSDERDRPLTLGERLRRWGHMVICVPCRIYGNSLSLRKKLMSAVEEYKAGQGVLTNKNNFDHGRFTSGVFRRNDFNREVRCHTEELTDTIVRLSDEIEMQRQAEKRMAAMLQLAEQARLAKSRFLSNISHELRTPLHSILGYSELLQMSELSPTDMSHINIIRSAGTHLLRLINDILDFSRIETGDMVISIRPVNLCVLLKEVLELMRPIADRHEIGIRAEFSANGEVCVDADETRLRQVLLNLVSNAVKYNKPNGTVHVGYELSGEKIRVNVRDTGRGFSAAQIERLFEPFNRLGAEQSKIEGTGLGLSIAKKLVEQMKGTIGLRSEVGVGTTFSIEIPPSERNNGLPTCPASALGAAD